jgi:uncharacterized protein
VVGRLPEHHVARPVALQRWETLTFVHWAYDPADLQHLVPSGLELDLHQGRAWVSLTPFLMTRVRAPGTPAIPGISAFPETNVRTYVRDGSGRDGLLFLTLECARFVTTVARPALGLPYSWAQMAVDPQAQGARYTSRRRWPRDPTADLDLRVEVGAPIDEPAPLDDWLTGRWRAFTGRDTVRTCVAVEHEPWPLRSATVAHLRGGLVAATGVPAPAGEPVVHFSAGVDVRLGRPRAV